MPKLLSRLIFVLLLALLLLTAVPYGTVDPWWQAAFECYVFALGILWMIECLSSKDWRLYGGMLHAPLLLLVAFAYVQTLPLMSAETTGTVSDIRRSISVDPYQTWVLISRLLALMLAGELLLRYTSNEKRLRALIYTIIGIAVASAIFGIVRQAAQGDGVGFLLPQLLPGKSGYAQFTNRNHFAFLIEMALGLASGLIIRGFVKREQVLHYIAVAVLLWAAIIFSTSRGGILGVFSQILLLALMFRRVQSRKRHENDEGDKGLGANIRALVTRGAVLVCLALALVLSVIYIGGDKLVDRFETLSSDTSTTESQSDLRSNLTRTDIWRPTLELIKERPITGIGFGGYWVAISRYHDSSGKVVPLQAHNEYLEILASGGLIAFALFVWFAAMVTMKARDNLQTRGTFGRAVCVGALSGLFAVAMHSLVEFGLHATINAYVFTALIVIAVRKVPREQARTHHRSPAHHTDPPSN